MSSSPLGEDSEEASCPPCRLHGDLWNGNVLWGLDGHAWLIDPAAYGGHRETDLAMLALFGCPQLPRVLDAYQEATPLADGWEDQYDAIGGHTDFYFHTLGQYLEHFDGRLLDDVTLQRGPHDQPGGPVR